MCICMHVCYVYACICMYVCMHVCMYVLLCRTLYVCTYDCTHLHVYVSLHQMNGKDSVHVCMYTHTCLHRYMYVYMYITCTYAPLQDAQMANLHSGEELNWQCMRKWKQRSSSVRVQPCSGPQPVNIHMYVCMYVCMHYKGMHVFMYV
jgi:hypothetical protein